MPCHICQSTVQEGDLAEFGFVTCPRCGPYQLLHKGGWVGALAMQLKRGRGEAHRRSRLSHICRTSTGTGSHFGLVVDEVERLDLDAALPTPSQAIDRLVLWVAAHQPNYVETVELPIPEVSAWVGAPITASPPSADALAWILNQEACKRLFFWKDRGTGKVIGRLTMEGWERHSTLISERNESRTAFMALKFGDAELDRIVRDCFRPAVAQAGFELRTLTDNQGAGLIDDQLRVALRTSRFLIADLSHSNNGAYWEAGFAEGLGRPVIYTCSESAWSAQRTHFDTNHLVTIIWSAERAEEVGEKLTACIRATLPAEAAMQAS